MAARRPYDAEVIVPSAMQHNYFFSFFHVCLRNQAPATSSPSVIVANRSHQRGELAPRSTTI
ncbi:hypothetical protein SESBI_10671 [Sesbania bispinosa]|nr:hypothetical protein SESBI_10671 [Sesbania bispinosa]